MPRSTIPAYAPTFLEKEDVAVCGMGGSILYPFVQLETCSRYGQYHATPMGLDSSYKIATMGYPSAGKLGSEGHRLSTS